MEQERREACGWSLLPHRSGAPWAGKREFMLHRDYRGTPVGSRWDGEMGSPTGEGEDFQGGGRSRARSAALTERQHRQAPLRCGPRDCPESSLHLGKVHEKSCSQQRKRTVSSDSRSCVYFMACVTETLNTRGRTVTPVNTRQP